MENPTENLTPDPRKLPPWHLTGIVACTRKKHDRGIFGGITSTYTAYGPLRERWDNTETGEIELRPLSLYPLEEDGER